MYKYKNFRWTILALTFVFLVSLVFADAKEDDQRMYFIKILTMINNLDKGGNQMEIVKKLVDTAEEFYKKYPEEGKEPILYLYVAEAVEGVDIDQAKTVYKRIKELGNDEWKERAEGSLNRLDMLGKPVSLKFTAVDGRKVDLDKLKGKVVLVDFWATWCGPCMHELPNVVKTYKKLHKKGFEIIGISFDEQKSRLKDVVKENGMSWPQYFDGAGWGNKFGKQFGISSIPSMWLIDQKGTLVDLNARDNLEEKVTKLLAEK